ncbi:MAG: DUF429 domain-containing protein [Acidiferrobacterales bacterium]|nr:DUF429 domain-containing protein [Acidiferrobacterales bacterium]
MCAYFISADWSKDPTKRSVYVADIDKKSIQKKNPKTEYWNLKALLDLANSLRGSGPVLIGVDVVLGVSDGYWRMVREKSERHKPKNFVDWLSRIDPDSDFFHINTDSREWHVDRPWFRVPKGEGGLRSFTDLVCDGFRRCIDRATNAKPVFAVSGIPGVVGGATRCFWRELIPALTCGDREFTIWPFENDLSGLLHQDSIFLCETYPGIAYATALAEADELPTRRLIVSKTKREQRNEVCELLKEANWVKDNEIELGELEALVKNDDDFDAHLTAAAAMRCVIEKRRLTSRGWIDEIAEGSMLLVGTVNLAQRGRRFQP